MRVRVTVRVTVRVGVRARLHIQPEELDLAEDVARERGHHDRRARGQRDALLHVEHVLAPLG